jgi:putative membrane protein
MNHSHEAGGGRRRAQLFQGVFMKISAFVITGALLISIAGVSAQAVNDAQIAKIVVTANQVDIDAGKLAAAKATNPEVKKFAQTMVTDHTGVNKQAVALVTKLKVTPEDNDTAKGLYSGGTTNVANLKTLKGKDFDKAYIDHEVAYHQAVIDAVDKTLIPGAQNEELKALLVKVRPAFVAHLEHAKKVQADLSK